MQSVDRTGRLTPTRGRVQGQAMSYWVRIGLSVSIVSVVIGRPPADATCTRYCAVTFLLNACTEAGIEQGWPEGAPLRLGVECLDMCCAPVPPPHDPSQSHTCSASPTRPWLPGVYITQHGGRIPGDFFEAPPECGFGGGVIGSVLEFEGELEPGDYAVHLEYDSIPFSVTNAVPVLPTPGPSYSVSVFAADSSDCSGESRSLAVELVGADRVVGVRRYGWSPYTFENVPPGEYRVGPFVSSFGRECWRSRQVTVDSADAETTICGCDPTPTPTVGPACAGDCNLDGRVRVEEIVEAIRIALCPSCDAVGGSCMSADTDRDGRISIGELIRLVHNSLHGCG